MLFLWKTKNKNNVASNYKPIISLPLVWRLFARMLSENIYMHLDSQKSFPEESKYRPKRMTSREKNLTIS